MMRHLYGATTFWPSIGGPATDCNVRTISLRRFAGRRPLVKAAPGADAKVINLAVRASQCSIAQGAAPVQRLAIIDYSLPSTEQRLWVFDLKKRKLLFHELVAHGRNSGENMAVNFSSENQNESFAAVSACTGHSQVMSGKTVTRCAWKAWNPVSATTPLTGRS